MRRAKMWLNLLGLYYWLCSHITPQLWEHYLWCISKMNIMRRKAKHAATPYKLAPILIGWVCSKLFPAPLPFPAPAFPVIEYPWTYKNVGNNILEWTCMTNFFQKISMHVGISVTKVVEFQDDLLIQSMKAYYVNG